MRVGSRSEYDPKPQCRCTKARSPMYLIVARKRKQPAYFLPGCFHRRGLFASEAPLKRQEDGPKAWLDRGPNGRGILCIPGIFRRCYYVMPLACGSTGARSAKHRLYVHREPRVRTSEHNGAFPARPTKSRSIKKELSSIGKSHLLRVLMYLINCHAICARPIRATRAHMAKTIYLFYVLIKSTIDRSREGNN